MVAILAIVAIVLSIICITKNSHEKFGNVGNEFTIYLVSHGTAPVMVDKKYTHLKEIKFNKSLEQCPIIPGYNYQLPIKFTDNIIITSMEGKGITYNFNYNGSVLTVYKENTQYATVPDTKAIIFNIENGQIDPIYEEIICPPQPNP